MRLLILKVRNGDQFAVLATPFCWVFVWRTANPVKKTTFFSKKLPVNLYKSHNGQIITLKILLAAQLFMAAKEGIKLTADQWAKTPELENWSKR